MGILGHSHGFPTADPRAHGTCVLPDDATRGACRCPACGAPGLIRIHRRPIDRFLSLFVGLQRYRCPQFQCQWEGNLSQRRIDKGTRSRKT